MRPELAPGSIPPAAGKAIFFLSILIFLAACAPVPQSEELVKEGKACIKGTLATPGSSSAHTGINVFPPRAGLPYSWVCVPAGNRVFLAAAASAPNLGVNVLVRMELKAGHLYRIRATHQSGEYRFAITDTTRGEPVLVYAFGVPDGYMAYHVLREEVLQQPIDLSPAGTD